MNQPLGLLICHKRALKFILIQRMQMSLNEKFSSLILNENHSDSNFEAFADDDDAKV